MKSSAYYYKQMQDISAKADKLSNKCSEYAAYCEKLVSLYNSCSEGASDVQDSLNTLSSGGYVANGEIPHQEDVVSGTKSLDEGLIALADAINNTNTDIENMTDSIKTLNNKFKVAESNYKKAKQIENS